MNLSSLSRARVGGSRPPVRRRRRAPTRARFALNATPRTPRAPPTPMVQGPAGLKAPRGRSPAQTQLGWVLLVLPPLGRSAWAVAAARTKNRQISRVFALGELWATARRVAIIPIQFYLKLDRAPSEYASVVGIVFWRRVTGSDILGVGNRRTNTLIYCYS